MRFLLLLALMQYSDFASTQNLVPNNGFETYSSLPNGYGQWYKISGWYNLNGYAAFAWPYASADYLHTSGSGGVGLPFTTFATVNAFAGNAIAGLTTWHGTTPEFREYLAIQLSSPMVVDSAYTISMWITNGSSAWYCGASSNHIGLKFTTAMPSQTDHEPIGGIPQCEYAGEIWSTGWQLLSFTYIPDQPYQYITIGNFYNDASTTHTTHYAFAMSNAAYYFIDEVVVMKPGPLPVTLSNFYAEKDQDNVKLSWETESELNTHYFIVERSDDATNFIEIAKVSAAGYSNQLNQYTCEDDHPLNGVNYYRLITVDYNENRQSSDVISITMDDQLTETVNVYPNPCEDQLNIDLSGESSERIFSIYNLHGELLLRYSSSQVHLMLDVSKFISGVYFVQVQNGGNSITKEIIVR